jgi:hypothetical protein
MCHAIIDPPWARHLLSEGMRHAALCHTEMPGELASLCAVVSSTMESALGCSPNDTFRVEVVGELVVKFQKLEERRSQLEHSAMRICDLLLGPPPGRARLADRLDEAARQLGAELATQREADAELEALQTLVVRLQDWVLESADRPSSLASSMSTTVELLEGRINIESANRVLLGSCSTLVTTVRNQVVNSLV